MLFFASFTCLAQLDVPYTGPGGPMGYGSWLRFLTGGGNTTSIQESWGLNITGTNLQPVKIVNTSLLVGYTSANQDFGQNNLFVNGNVGIGTTTPSGLLSLGNSVSNKKLLIYDWGGDVSGMGQSYAEFRIFDPVSGTNHISVGKYNSTNDAFAEQMRIDYNGNVGIGTTSPNAKLDVRQGAISIGNGNLDPNYTNLNFLAGTGSVLIGQNRTVGANETDFIANSWPASTGGFAFYNHDNNNIETQLMWILGNGQVLIGNTQGNQGNYMLAVAGSAIATSVTVKTVSNWPDYVFKPNYKPISLTALKRYIDENQHLPEVPSARQVEKDGLNLGEMNKTLLKKVEELTLYLIEKDKQLKEQQMVISNQQTQLSEILVRLYKLEQKKIA